MEKIKLLVCALALGALLNACGNQAPTVGKDDTIVGDTTTPEDPSNGQDPEIAEETPDQGKPGLKPGKLENLDELLGEKEPDFPHICVVKPEICEGLFEEGFHLPERRHSPDLFVKF